jgi:hypothetical protein
MHKCFVQQNGNSPLHIAAENGNEAIVEGLLEKDADINEVDSVSGAELSVVWCFLPFLYCIPLTLILCMYYAPFFPLFFLYLILILCE